jgi:thioredoxin-like negative regulator of GroEL
MRKIVLLFAAFIALAAAPALAGKAFAPYEKAWLEAMIKAGEPVIVHVHADWCPTCRRQITIFDELFKEPAFARVQTVRVDYDRDRDFLAAYKVRSQSTILAFKGGQEVARLNGDTDWTKIRAAIAKTL